MAHELQGKSAIVTGAADGVGLAIARRFVQAGAAVLMADIDEDKLAAEVETLSGYGYDGKAAGFHGDLRQKLSMSNLMAATLDAHDGIDILVNGIFHYAPSDPLDPEADHFEETIARNVTANLRISQIAARRMIGIAAAETLPVDRVILNLSSIYGRRTLPGLLAFSVASAAVDQVTRSLAVELATWRIRVNAVAVGDLPEQAPGQAPSGAAEQEALTAFAPPSRLGVAHEAAEAALFLASPSAGFVTGQILDVDGGQSLRDRLGTSAT